jgi:uncharacterized protein with von Willebrand factor type A (vWA) domain
MYPFTSLPENLIAFCAVLRRDHGFRIGPGEVHDAARALEVVDLSDEHAVRHALRPILSGTLHDVTVFDQAFTDFMFPGPARVRQGQMPSTRREPGSDADGREERFEQERRATPAHIDADDVDVAPEVRAGPIAPVETTDSDLEVAALLARSSYSPLEAEGTDAPDLTRAESAWRDAARSLVRRLEVGLSRRWRSARSGRRFDLRRTLRVSLQTGGEALTPRWLRRPRRTPRLVLLIDGSRSMSAHARTALQVAVALASITRRVEVFTFSTALQRVTGDVRRAAAGETRHLESVQYAWGGGTSIGVCLREFLRKFGERLLGRDTVVIIASDGLDVGEPDTLRGAMSELHRRSAGLVWLNPLLETPGYEPTARGMSAARPYVTTFATVTDVASLARLSRVVRVRV